MSFIQRGLHHGGLVRDSFPNDLARNRQEPVEHLALSSHLVIPSARDNMFDWAKVVPAAGRDPSRRHELVYKKGKSGTTMANRVSLRLYGFLGVHNFHPYGNWDGEESGAVRAMSFLKLEPGCFPEQYAEQMQAIDDLRHMIQKSLPSYRESKRAEKQDIFIQRRVFKKVEGPGNRQQVFPTNALDMSAKAQNIVHKWIVEQCVDYGRKSESGRIVSCDPFVFNEGDFVDVHVTFDIITSSRGRNKFVTVHMAPSQVVRLARAEAFAKMSPQTGVITSHPTTFMVATEDKLVFDEEGGSSEQDGGS